MDRYAKTLILVARLSGLVLSIYVMRPISALLGQEISLFRVRDSTFGWVLSNTLWNLLEFLPSLILLALALHLMLGGRWLIRRMLRGLDNTCPACAHPFPDEGRRCTECGFRFRREP